MGEINLEGEYNNFEKTILKASSLNFTNKDFTPLLYNIYHKTSKEDIIRTLNAADESSLFERDSFENCIIHFVAEFGNKESFEIVFNKLSDVFIDDQNKVGETPLMLAAKAGNKDIVQFLINKGTDINKKDIYGLNPISIAAMNGQTEIIELLFKKSLEQKPKEIVEPDGNTINRAPRSKQLFKPSSLSFEDNSKKAPRTINRQEKKGTSIIKEQTIVNYIDMPDEFGFTPLENAISNGHLETAKKLIELGAKINEDDLYYAVSKGHADIAEYLHSIKIFEHNQKLENYAIEAIKNGETDILKFLVENKYSNPNKRDLNGKTLLDYSIENRKEEMTEYLNNKTNLDFKKNKVTNTNIIHGASKKGNQNIIKILTTNNNKKNRIKKFFKGKDDDGNIPLYYAIKNKDAESAKYIIEEMYEKKLINEKNFSNIIDFLYSDEKKQLRKEIFNNLSEEIVDKIKKVKDGIKIEKFYEEGLMEESEYKTLKYDFNNDKINVKEKINLMTRKRNEIIKAKEKLEKIELFINNNLSEKNKNRIKEIEEELKKYKVDTKDKTEISEDSSKVSESENSERSSIISEVEQQIPKSKSQTIVVETSKPKLIKPKTPPRPKTPNNSKGTTTKTVHMPSNKQESIRLSIKNSDKKLNDLKSINKDLDEIMKEDGIEQDLGRI